MAGGIPEVPDVYDRVVAVLWEAVKADGGSDTGSRAGDKTTRVKRSSEQSGSKGTAAGGLREGFDSERRAEEQH